MKRDRRDGLTVAEWKQILFPREMEALEHYSPKENDEVYTPSEVLDAIVSWEGGISSSCAIRRMIERIYGVDLEG